MPIFLKTNLPIFLKNPVLPVSALSEDLLVLQFVNTMLEIGLQIKIMREATYFRFLQGALETDTTTTRLLYRSFQTLHGTGCFFTGTQLKYGNPNLSHTIPKKIRLEEISTYGYGSINLIFFILGKKILRPGPVADKSFSIKPYSKFGSCMGFFSRLPYHTIFCDGKE